MPPSVSVILSVYNGAQYLREAVDGILRQTFHDFEFLIVNDGSTDESAAILESFRDPRIRVIRNPRNQGLTPSLNIALRQAQGVYVARQDADDISFPDRLVRQVEYLSAHDAVLAVGTQFPAGVALPIHPRIQVSGFRPHPLLDAAPKRLPTHPRIIQYFLMRNNMICHGSVMFRRTAVESINGYAEHFSVGQDYDLWLRLAELGELANLPTADYFWRRHAGQISVRRRAEHDAVRAEIQRLAWQRQFAGEDALQRRLPAPPGNDRLACSRLFTWNLSAFRFHPDAFSVTRERWCRYCRENGFDPREIAQETLVAMIQPHVHACLTAAREKREKVVVFPAGNYARLWLPIWYGLFADGIAGWYDDRASAPLDDLPKIAPKADSCATILLAAESDIPALMDRARALFGSRALIIRPDDEGG